MNQIAFIAALAGIFLMSKAPQKIAQQLARIGPRWNNLTPVMRDKVARVIAALDARGIIVGIPSTGGWRSLDDQRAIDPDNTNVVDPLDSYHVWGLAVDLVPINAAGKFYWPPADDPTWQAIGEEGARVGLQWGGNFSSIFDGPHLQLAVESLASLKATFGTPAAFMRRFA